ncbi:MAG: hypothetical protein JWP05_1450 [Microbacteriaceae bacterium]|nr:hypothetical protein [Microbacteriaceae bacterium]
MRGINVGTAKAVPMAELARVFEGLGFVGVKTVLRSGNIVFDAGQGDSAPIDTVQLAETIEAAIGKAIGVRSSVLVIDAAGFIAIADASPLRNVATDGSKSFVTFLGSVPDTLELPDAAAIAPEILVVGDRALYQWIPAGSQQTKVPRSFWKQFDSPVTTRNWNTVGKLVALLH